MGGTSLYIDKYMKNPAFFLGAAAVSAEGAGIVADRGAAAACEISGSWVPVAELKRSNQRTGTTVETHVISGLEKVFCASRRPERQNETSFGVFSGDDYAASLQTYFSGEAFGDGPFKIRRRFSSSSCLRCISFNSNLNYCK
uniref:Uncharacterized protein n=1 Tax=Romanomermis culicivorax TaxID=13658 RepID=A0A915IU05_ROMCU